MSSDLKQELSDREREILDLVATGASNKEIASDLDISENTVKVHLRNIFAKMGVRSRTEATVAAMEAGLVHPAGQPEVPAEVVAPEAPSRAPSPVYWWQKLLLVAALVLAVGVVAWPGSPEAQTPPPVLDPLREVGGGSANGLAEDDVGRWHEAAQMPRGRHRFAAARVGDQIIVVGGDTEEGITGEVEIYDRVSNTWRQGAPKPTPVSNVGAAVVGGLIYIPGGLLPDGSVTDVIEIYDPQEDSWQAGPNLPTPLCAYAVTTDGGRVLVFGGWDGAQYSNVALALDPGEQVWTEMPNLPHARLQGAAAYLQGRAYLIGGFDGRQALREVDVLDLDAGEDAEWQRGPDLIEARAGLGAAVIGDTLYVVGGGWSEPTAFCERLVAGDGRWQQWEMPVAGAWRNMGVVADDTTIYAMGGWKDAILATVFRYQAVYRVMLPLSSR